MKSWAAVQERQEAHPPKHQSAESRKWIFSIVLKIVATLGIVFFLSFKRISYNEKAAQTVREISRIQRDIHLKERTISNLRMQKERLMDYRYVKNRNESLNLGLVPAQPGQVRRTALLSNPDAEIYVFSEDHRTASR